MRLSAINALALHRWSTTATTTPSITELLGLSNSLADTDARACSAASSCLRRLALLPSAVADARRLLLTPSDALTGVQRAALLVLSGAAPSHDTATAAAILPLGLADADARVRLASIAVAAAALSSPAPPPTAVVTALAGRLRDDDVDIRQAARQALQAVMASSEAGASAALDALLGSPGPVQRTMEF